MFKELNYLKIFFDEPEKEFHLREIGRIVKKNPVTVKKYLSKFVDCQVLLCRKERGFDIYSSNVEGFYYKELKRFYNRLNVIGCGLLDFLKEEFNFPVIVLFGSYNTGGDGKFGDIDIFVLSEVKKELGLDLYEKRLHKTIQLHVMNEKKFRQIKINNPDLANSILNGSILSGFLEIL